MTTSPAPVTALAPTPTDDQADVARRARVRPGGAGSPSGPGS